jgi:hypothetical protein
MNDDLYHCCFVSGHRNITQEEFEEHYVPKLKEGMSWSAIFVIGDYYGVDEMTQKYLKDQGYPDKLIRVYHMLKDPRCCHVGEFCKIGGFKSDEDRDDSMTFASTMDIAWVRPGKENSGTAQNLARRQRDNIMVAIAEAENNLIQSLGGRHSTKFQKLFDAMQKHLKDEWKKLTGEFVEENEGE